MSDIHRVLTGPFDAAPPDVQAEAIVMACVEWDWMVWPDPEEPDVYTVSVTHWGEDQHVRDFDHYPTLAEVQGTLAVVRRMIEEDECPSP